MAIGTGDKLPDFSLDADDGSTVGAATLYRDGPAVVFFYPKDETFGCVREVCAFRDQFADFVAAGATVVGISSDDTGSHRDFVAHHRLPFRLLADPQGRVRALFGVPRTLGLLPGRTTYVVDKQGTVRDVFSSQFAASRHPTQALDMVRQLAQEG